VIKLNYLVFNSPLGWMGVLDSPRGLKRLVLPQSSPEQVLHLLSQPAMKQHNQSLSEAEAGHFGDLPDRIRDYLAGKAVSFSDKLDLSWASAFQRRVWEVERSIPYGETRTYAWIACKLSMPKAARAVGQALAKNPLPIIIPCHRVICSDGSLGGFGGGQALKRRLLRIEARAK
jgi:methylated-DNA-[protein]-cysteine S-methyltransferase